jgi:hypothetical protein
VQKKKQSGEWSAFDEAMAQKFGSSYYGSIDIGGSPAVQQPTSSASGGAGDYANQGGQGSGYGSNYGSGSMPSGYDPGLVDPMTGRYQGVYDWLQNPLPQAGTGTGGAAAQQTGGLSDAIAQIQQQQATQQKSTTPNQSNLSYSLEAVKRYGQPSQSFDRDSYLRANPDVAAAGLDPWYHWNKYGQYEGRSLGVDQSGAGSAGYQQQPAPVAAPKPQISQVDPTHWAFMDIPPRGMAKEYIDWMMTLPNAPEIASGWDQAKKVLGPSAAGLMALGPVGATVGLVAGLAKAAKMRGANRTAIEAYVLQELGPYYTPEVIQSLLDEYFLPPGGQGGDGQWEVGPGNKFFDYTLNYLGDYDGNQGNYWRSDSEQSPPWGWDDTQQLWVDAEGNPTEPPGLSELMSGYQGMGEGQSGVYGWGHGEMSWPDPYSTPMWGAAKYAAEDQYDIAKKKAMETMPTGGPLYSALGSLEAHKAGTLTQEHGRIGQDFYNKSFANDQLMKQLANAYGIAELGGNINLQLGQMQADTSAQQIQNQADYYDNLEKQQQRENYMQGGALLYDMFFGDDGFLGGLF